MRNPRVGDKVITKGYSTDYDGKELTINRIDVTHFNNIGTYMFCYFDEAEHPNHNFDVKDIVKYVNHMEPVKQIPKFKVI